MSGGVGARRVQASPRAEQVRQELWLEAQAGVIRRLSLLDRGAAWAPEPVVRCLRLFVASDRLPAEGHDRVSPAAVRPAVVAELGHFPGAELVDVVVAEDDLHPSAGWKVEGSDLRGVERAAVGVAVPAEGGHGAESAGSAR